mmetsp:Transcript_23710/g.47872  ORF Transcript_23710/g.47872 Transcript_23710/m.47872 type:complete len:325 (+) Transcript_23710:127-1101(+)
MSVSDEMPLQGESVVAAEPAQFEEKGSQDAEAGVSASSHAPMAVQCDEPVAAQSQDIGSVAGAQGGKIADLSSKEVPNKTRETWDPLTMPKGAPASWCLRRIKKDLRSLYADPLPGIFVYVDETDFTLVHALVVGPFESPYEGGFFYFVMKCPDDYPNNPPKVRLMTTGGGTVRFNPNLYIDGKVCLSILGTWNGPSWSPGQSLGSVLLSIQSLMNEKPYHNEPGFEQERQAGDASRYNDCIRHETLRAAVCDMLEGKVAMPEALVSTMEKTFIALCDHYLEAARARTYLDGGVMLDLFKEQRGHYRHGKIAERLEELRQRLVA